MREHIEALTIMAAAKMARKSPRLVAAYVGKAKDFNPANLMVAEEMKGGGKRANQHGVDY